MSGQQRRYWEGYRQPSVWVKQGEIDSPSLHPPQTLPSFRSMGSGHCTSEPLGAKLAWLSLPCFSFLFFFFLASLSTVPQAMHFCEWISDWWISALNFKVFWACARVIVRPVEKTPTSSHRARGGAGESVELAEKGPLISNWNSWRALLIFSQGASHHPVLKNVLWSLNQAITGWSSKLNNTRTHAHTHTFNHSLHFHGHSCPRITGWATKPLTNYWHSHWGSLEECAVSLSDQAIGCALMSSASSPHWLSPLVIGSALMSLALSRHWLFPHIIGFYFTSLAVPSHRRSSPEFTACVCVCVCVCSPLPPHAELRQQACHRLSRLHPGWGRAGQRQQVRVVLPHALLFNRNGQSVM